MQPIRLPTLIRFMRNHRLNRTVLVRQMNGTTAHDTV